MQPHNVYSPSSGARNAQQSGRMPRGSSSNQDPRNGVHHVNMPPPTLYPAAMHQRVVLPTFTQYQQAQPGYPAQQLYAPSYTPHQVQQNFYPYHYYSPVQHPPQTQQRNMVNVGVNSGVSNVGSPMSVQAGLSAPLTGPTGANQAQLSLTTGNILPPGNSGTVIGVAGPAVEKQVPTSPMVTVGASISTPPGSNRRRKYALEIIDPNTNKNIFDDMDLSLNSSINKVDYQDEATSPPSCKPRDKKILSIVAPSDVKTSKVTESNSSEGISCSKIETDSTASENSNQQQEKTTETISVKDPEIINVSSLPVESSVESTTTGELSKMEILLDNLQINENTEPSDTTNNITTDIINELSTDAPTKNIDCQNSDSSVAADIAIPSSNIKLNDLEETLPEEDSHATKDLTTDETDCVPILQKPIEINQSIETEIKIELNDENNVIVVANIEIVPPTLTETVGDSTETTASDSNPADDASEPTITASIISYKEGQWSPNNPTGKKQYDRDQIMQLRGVGASLLKPDIKVQSILPQSNFMPSFMRNTNNNSQRVQSVVGDRTRNDAGNFGSRNASMSGINARGSMMGGGMIHVNLSLSNDVQLNVTDNAWKPRVLDKNADKHDPEEQKEREKEELVRRVRGILNKLTPENFDTLVEEIVKLKIDTPDKMEDVMNLVFEKAIDEPNFSVTYARLCHRLITEARARDERMESNTRSNLVHFRNALLNKTEAEFTINVTQSSAKEQKLQPIHDKIKKSTNLLETAELKLQLEEEERKIRRRSGGTVRFIGELFKISMLTGKIIYSCIDQLLNPNSEDMLECMCKLLTTVGAKFEHTPISNPTKKNPQTRLYSLDKIMVRIKAIAYKSDGPKISSRVRFMLKDVIELRENQWQSKRNEAPKTMEQIAKETKSEQLTSQYLNFSAGGNDRSGRFNESSRSSGGGNYGGSNSQRGEYNTGSMQRSQRSGNKNSGVGDDGEHEVWQVQGNKKSACAVDSNKLEGLQNIDRSIKKMGGLSQFQWTTNSTRQTSAATTTPANSFAALSSLIDIKSSNRDQNRERNDRDLKSGNRDQNRERNDRGPRNKGSYNKGSMERNSYGGNRDRGCNPHFSSQASREYLPSRNSQEARNMTTSSSIYKGGNSSNSAFYPPPNRQSDKLLSNATSPAIFEEPCDKDKKVYVSVINELLENIDCANNINQSTVSCISRISARQHCGFLFYILTEYLHLGNVKQIQRRYLSNVVAYLIKQKQFSVQHFKLSYENFCNLASDLMVDIPNLWLYIFEFTGPLLVNSIIGLEDLWIKILKEDSSLGPKFIKTLIIYCTREIGPNFTRKMWKQFNLKWLDFVPKNEVQNFIQSNKFQYVEDETLLPEIDTKETWEKRINRVIEQIDHLLREGQNVDSIIDYINGNIIDIKPSFIEKLSTSLANFAINYKDGSFKLDIDSFKKICIPVMHRYIESKEERELECLYSMQIIVQKLEHPRGLLNEIFVELYDAEVILQDSFIKWRESKDHSAGKGVAVKGLNPFFNHILSEETSD